MVFRLSLLFYILVVLCNNGNSLVHDLDIVEDDRDLFKIETFGFVEMGLMDIVVKDISIVKGKLDKSPIKMGFVMRKAASESSAQQDLEKLIEDGECILDKLTPDDVLLDLSEPTTWNEAKLTHYVQEGGEGLYSLIFARCLPHGIYKVNFKLHADFYNPGPNFLSAGDSALPAVYLVFFFLFTGALVVWCWVLSRPAPTGGTVHSIHYLMAALLGVKSICLLVESIRFHYIAIDGRSETWSIIYYIITTLRGIGLFTVILLIGSGWSLMKAHLNDREKKIIFFVLCLQVFDNIAMVILEESAPGSQGWLTWRDILHLVDIVCCCAILFPIVWSIKHLRQAADVDGKAQHSLAKLQLFREFYVMVVAYIYFTRIVVFLLSASIPFYLLWLGDMFTELATFAFYVVTGKIAHLEI